MEGLNRACTDSPEGGQWTPKDEGSSKLINWGLLRLRNYSRVFFFLSLHHNKMEDK